MAHVAWKKVGKARLSAVLEEDALSLCVSEAVEESVSCFRLVKSFV